MHVSTFPGSVLEHPCLHLLCTYFILTPLCLSLITKTVIKKNINCTGSCWLWFGKVWHGMQLEGQFCFTYRAFQSHSEKAYYIKHGVHGGNMQKCEKCFYISHVVFVLWYVTTNTNPTMHTFIWLTFRDLSLPASPPLLPILMPMHMPTHLRTHAHTHHEIIWVHAFCAVTVWFSD